MFFSPLVLHLTAVQETRVALLCLSTGNADGLGQLRSRELLHACMWLGIDRDDVMLVDDPRLQDGMHQRWAAAAVAEQVAEAVRRFQPGRVYTFDAGGVSGHPNHAATAAGVLQWWADTPTSSSLSGLPQLWQLQTVGLPCKYAGPLDVPLSWASTLLRRRWRGQQAALCLNLRRPRRAWRALLAHSSQMVWYRRLWLLLSRYMYVNTLVRL
ncbi:N-acetylglucosaminyl-phosphatidylinositol de-N-acetylase [Micractinium conductrix]|uniref:N-acetylglucosaminylphosphatidylinositol deacetylase n=1 Tax=Micractinium conductrix TaxID=554055 RepID=A0A2P6V3S8_9CHLO|nr:N-acetylglucosaminyl-phosphatidylinositol de-N-acetylase [Micractinium conductrix]|eukprot:PSC68734.1 N-acetylglucosaminyl-phosphatidylinositol de-N-acetylase [Micractinium conductrix]